MVTHVLDPRIGKLTALDEHTTQLWSVLVTHSALGQEDSVCMADFGTVLSEFHPAISLSGLFNGLLRASESQLSTVTPLSRLSHSALAEWLDVALESADLQLCKEGMILLTKCAYELAQAAPRARRRARERCAIDMCPPAVTDDGGERVWYLVDAQWLAAWRRFANSSTAEDHDPPGPISNHRLIDSKTREPIKGLKVPPTHIPLAVFHLIYLLGGKNALSRLTAVRVALPLQGIRRGTSHRQEQSQSLCSGAYRPPVISLSLFYHRFHN